MSEIKALDTLREELKVCGCDPDKCISCSVPRKIRDGLDEVEREIDERYIESPVDGNGNVIGIGDQLIRKGRVYIVNAFVWDGRIWYFTETIVSPAWIPMKKAVLFKPNTLEGVLEEFADAAADVDKRDREEWVPLLAKYADEICDLMGDEK